MKLHLLFIGNKFIYNKSLQEYIIRQIEKKIDFIDSITYFKESDNSLFLYLEKEINTSERLLIITTKQHFSTIGKLICTVTSDNQILKENMLIPSKVDVFEDGSYLLDYQDSIINVLHVDEMQNMPEILLNFQDLKSSIHLFQEDKQSALILLNPLAQTFDVQIDIVQLIDGWLKVNIRSNKYGNISKFTNAAKQLLQKKLIASSCLASYIIEKLSSQNKKISFAESCTGGLLTYFFTKNNGSSQILDGSLVTYSNTMKENWLGVNASTLEEFGAVSNEVVSQMSDGVMNVSNADYTISISGIAGDSGGSISKPVGTVYIGIRTKKEHQEIKLNLNGDRNYIQKQSVLHAVKMLILMDKDIFF